MMKKWVIIGIIACIVIIGLSVFFLIGLEPEEDGDEIIEPATLTQVTFLGSAADPDWSPDGSQIAFWDFAANKIGIINADGTGLRFLVPGGDPSWSPVENKIAYVANNQIYTINSSGGNNTQLTTEGASGYPAWSSDGTKIAYTNWGENASIWVMNADGSGKTQLTAEENEPCSSPSFNYDGSKIVYLRGRTSTLPQGEFEYGPNEIWVMDNDGSNKHQIYAPGDSSSLIFSRAWNKDNKILFMCRGIQESVVPHLSVWVINSDVSDPHPVVQRHPCGYGDPVWNNDGTKVAISRIVPGSQGGGVSSDIFVFSWEE